MRWQINDITFPKFNGEIGGCTYVYTSEWNTCAMFLKKTSQYIIQYIVDFMEMNKLDVYSDENYISILRRQGEIINSLTTYYLLLNP